MSVLISAWKRFWVVYATIYFVEVVALSMRCVFIHAYWCPTPFLYQMMFILFNSYADCTTSGTWSTDPSGTSEVTTGFCFCTVRVAQSLFVDVVIWDHFLSFFLLSLSRHSLVCLFFHKIQLYVTRIVSSNFSFMLF
jgi:hypothetical protein